VLVGTELPEPITVLPIVVTTTIAAGAACAWIDRADIPLQVAR
jgi:hypothetical protein